MNLSHLFLILVLVAIPSSGIATETHGLIVRIKAVGAKGQGHADAVAAAAELASAEAQSLPDILRGMNDAGPLTKNWLRGAFEAVAQRSLNSASGLDAQPLIAFFDERSNDPQTRRLAYEWIIQAEPEFAERTIPKSLDDPSSEMRRDAVAHYLEAAKKRTEDEDKEAAKKTYLDALSGAGDEDQVQTIVAALKDLGQDVNLVQHRGFLMQWKMIGPFDNKEMKGFNVEYPPESELQFTREYDGQLGKVAWKDFRSETPDGNFNIAELAAPHKGAVMYAATEFESDKQQPVEFRLATPNAWKLWVNGKPVFAHEEYHRGMFFDQYQVRGELKPGKNTLLLKVCQNEQKEDWAQDWKFQFRVCDLAGRALKPASADTALLLSPETRP